MLPKPAWSAAILLAFAALPATAATLTVNVTGISSGTGEVGCALFSTEKGFPLDATEARQIWQQAYAGQVTCQFKDLPPGAYAVAVAHDLNGNHKTDTDWLGLPTEAWGVSNNVRPSLRAPRFEEASFKIEEARDETLTIEVRK